MPTKSQIIIVTGVNDPHVDMMMRHLRSLGQEPCRVHPSDFTQGANVAVRLGPVAGSEVIVDSAGRRLALHEARSIWWRKPGRFVLDHLATAEERAYADEEVRHGWQGCLMERDCYFMSHPTAIRQARYKLGQLERARALGLTIPDTLVTSDVSDVREFCAAHPGGVVYKPMSQPFLRPGCKAETHSTQVAYTTLVTAAVLDDLGDLGLVPSLFQERVDKEVELRVTIIGDEVFVAEVKSQDNERTTIDWRHHEIDLPWSAGAIPDDVQAACIALTRGYGLNYGAIDLIRRPDGEHVFLEINANGQWLFVEERVPELRMMEAMAGCLIRGSNG